jgi:ferredoxin
MKATVNKDACIGCGACNAVCPEVFGFNDDEQYAVPLVEEVPEDKKDAAKEASEGCPTSAISVE